MPTPTNKALCSFGLDVNGVHQSSQLVIDFSAGDGVGLMNYDASGNLNLTAGDSKITGVRSRLCFSIPDWNIYWVKCRCLLFGYYRPKSK